MNRKSYRLFQSVDLKLIFFTKLTFGFFVLLIALYFPVGATNISENTTHNKIFSRIPMNISEPMNVDITINTTDITIEAAEKENKKRIDSLLTSMADPINRSTNATNMKVVAYSIAQINSPDLSLKEKYGNNTIYRVSSTVQINTNQTEQFTNLFRNSMSNLMNDDDLIKASCIATYEK